MYVAKEVGNVRIVHDGSPFDVAYDIKVEKLVENAWVFYAGFNSLSNDYAFAAANEAFARAAKSP